MEKEIQQPTLGAAIDLIVSVLKGLDQNAQFTALKASCEYLGIPALGNFKKSETLREMSSGESPLFEVTPEPKIVDIKTLRNQKNPKTVLEMAAIVAFYLAELSPKEDRKTDVTVQDLVKFFKQAGFPLPKRPDAIFGNAKNAGYFEPTSWGRFRLTPVGYNLAAHNLPRSSNEGIPRKERRAPKTKKSNKKK
ncbi:MAG: hypothetical protein WC133_02015 [Candidatus Omnitrophota bacterium]